MTDASAALIAIRAQVVEATAARKCHGCGCFHKTIDALEQAGTVNVDLAAVLKLARAAFIPQKYDCLGCAECFPAVAANVLADAFPGAATALDLCPTEPASERTGWPPLPGNYEVLRFAASVAICTLNDQALADELVAAAPEGVALIGTLSTENLGIERVIRNVVANPNIRFLIVTGRDSEQRVGHLPGQSMVSLLTNGIDANARIIGAAGKRPLLKNIDAELIATFRRQVQLVTLIGETGLEPVLTKVRECATTWPAPFADERAAATTLAVVDASEPTRLTSDPAGFLVVYPDPARQRIAVEHYSNDGVIDAVIVGRSAVAVYTAIIERQLISRLDHAAYLGRELARAEQCMKTGERYTQDRAPGEEAPEAISAPAPAKCGCGPACATPSENGVVRR